MTGILQKLIVVALLVAAAITAWSVITSNHLNIG